MIRIRDRIESPSFELGALAARREARRNYAQRVIIPRDARSLPVGPSRFDRC